MFDAEMRGQISDGKYENSSPFRHYDWVSETVYCIDGEEYHSNFGHTKRYNLNEWVRNIKSILETGEPKEHNYDFVIRMYDYGKIAQSFKSEIVNLQSIGRCMLKTDEKDTFYMYDLVDVFPTKRIYTQGLAKIKTYQREGFEYRIINK